MEEQAGITPRPGRPIGIGTPGSEVPGTGLIQNANSTCLNRRPLRANLEQLTQRPILLANDADCLALSESADGAAAGCKSAFAAILGTGVGGAFVHEGQLLRGPLAVAGEWGHNPLPRPTREEVPGPPCWCGRAGCIEAWLSGPALAADHQRTTGQALSAEEIAMQESGETRQTMRRYTERLARALASVVNLLDPAIIVLGGGLSRVESLYRDLPALMEPHLFTDAPQVNLAAAAHGSDSGVRGAARLCAPAR